jgi:DNA-binding response OmpR family regulator
MQVLIAEDNPVYGRMLQSILTAWGYDVIVVADGLQAWEALQQADPPGLAIMDWMMPGLSGLEVCRRVRQTPRLAPIYLVLLTAKDDKQDIVAGLDSGADDYLTKPFHHQELCARLQVGIRVVELQRSLANRVRQLEEAHAWGKQLEGLLPICAWCKKIRDDHNNWQDVENYIAACARVRFSHGICPNCLKRVMEEEMVLPL